MKHLVVDDHTLIRDAMQAVLETVDPQAQVLVADCAARARAVLADQPDVDLALLDVGLPDADGLALLSEFRAAHPAMTVVMLSGECDPATVRRALDAGASGFIPKSESRQLLITALTLVLAGGVYVPRVALGGIGAAPAATPAGRPAPGTLGLTERQLDVLALIMKGRSNKHICRELNLAEPTVKNHVTAILRALNVTSRTEAVLAVTKLGWTLDRP